MYVYGLSLGIVSRDALKEANLCLLSITSFFFFFFKDALEYWILCRQLLLVNSGW